MWNCWNSSLVSLWCYVKMTALLHGSVSKLISMWDCIVVFFVSLKLLWGPWINIVPFLRSIDFFNLLICSSSFSYDIWVVENSLSLVEEVTISLVLSGTKSVGKDNLLSPLHSCLVSLLTSWERHHEISFKSDMFYSYW